MQKMSRSHQAVYDIDVVCSFITPAKNELKDLNSVSNLSNLISNEMNLEPCFRTFLTR